MFHVELVRFWNWQCTHIIIDYFCFIIDYFRYH